RRAPAAHRARARRRRAARALRSAARRAGAREPDRQRAEARAGRQRDRDPLGRDGRRRRAVRRDRGGRRGTGRRPARPRADLRALRAGGRASQGGRARPRARHLPPHRRGPRRAHRRRAAAGRRQPLRLHAARRQRVGAARRGRRRSSGVVSARPARRSGGPRVLVVDDAEGIRTYLANLLELHGYQVDAAEDGRRALALLESGAAPDLVLLDVMLPGIDGIETLRRLREIDPDVPVVMLSVVGKASTIVEAMRLGAVDYLNKPFEEEELEATLRNALERREPERERERLLAELDEGARGAVWHGKAMQRVRQLIDQVAPVNVTVLIQGESGVGKEVVARALHEGSPRAKHAFVKVNCAALPEDLLESELFGYERGAFTGAVSRKPGKFEVADQGTIFLDEIGEMSPALQAKLLQVLQDATFSRLGGNREIRVDVRVVCATHRPLAQMAAAGQFREDLYHRLNVVDIHIPPLRERRRRRGPGRPAPAARADGGGGPVPRGPLPPPQRRRHPQPAAARAARRDPAAGRDLPGPLRASLRPPAAAAEPGADARARPLS